MSTEPTKTLVIDESRWLCGVAGNDSLCRDGKYCAVGFLGLAIGAPLADLEAYGLLSELNEDLAVSSGLVSVDDDCDADGFPTRHLDTKLEGDITSANDDTALDDATRKETLRVLFAKCGWRLEFERTSPPVSMQNDDRCDEGSSGLTAEEREMLS